MNKALTILQSPLKFKLFLLMKLPMGFLAGLKIESITPETAIISFKYSYLTKNPFRSIYFACLAMAGELASGSLGLIRVYGAEKPVSMLVVNMEATFTKKAIGKIKFRCGDGLLIDKAIEETKRTGEGVMVKTTSIGKDEKGDEVAQFTITWSFKLKK